MIRDDRRHIGWIIRIVGSVTLARAIRAKVLGTAPAVAGPGLFARMRMVSAVRLWRRTGARRRVALPRRVVH